MTLRDPVNKVAVVFGGSGFIGRHIVPRLARRGWGVRVAVRYPSRALFLKPAGVVGQVVPVFTDLRDDASVAAVLDGADLAINLVGILAEGGRQRFSALHAEGAERITRLAKAAGIERLVHVSAIGASAESASVYAKTKAAGEAAVRTAFPEATILRPSVVFGPEDKFFNLFAGLTRVSPVLPLIGGGGTRFQPVYVGDVADAAMACLDNPATRGKTYELGGPKVYTFKEIMELVLRETRRQRWLVSVPWGLAALKARFLELLPSPMLTRDQLALMKSDNVVAAGMPGLTELGITPTAAETILPTYMVRFRPGGRFSDKRIGGGDHKVAT